MAALPKLTRCKICPYYVETKDFGQKRPKRYCTQKGETQKRRIGSKVSSRFPPDWCPLYRDPPTLRIYALTEIGEFMQSMEDLQPKKSRRLVPPLSHRYFLRLETKSLTTARQLCNEIQELQKEQYADMQDVAERLGTKVTMHEVLEFDDGIQQIFLYSHRNSGEWLNLREVWFDKRQVRPTRSEE